MFEQYYAVVMAGGGGTRLWPLSRGSRPKQMLSFDGKRTLFQLAIDRLLGIFQPENILVVTVASQAPALQAQFPQLPWENFLAEPMPRGTASVVGLAAVALQQRDPQATMAVVTADHIIQNVPYFLTLLSSGFDVAQEGYLVTLGIQPDSPSTGYGYIQTGEHLGVFGQNEARRALRFTEKPDEATARKFIAGGDHFWNSGMFIWRIDRILEEFRRSMPELYPRLDTISAAWNTPQKETVVAAEWPQIRPETIDYGIMEKAKQVAVLPAQDLGWSDVGSWDSLFGVLPADAQANIVLGANFLGLDSRSTLVYSDKPDRLIVTIGAQDLIVVDTGDALLICPKNEAQKVREVVNRLKQDNLKDYL
jgi:mannose-1-phosphate guanylyltransferase